MTATSASAPPTPPGQGSAAPGVRAERSATQTIQRSGQSHARSNTSATHGQSGTTRAAASPSTVTAAMTGTTNRLAGSEMRLTRSTIRSSTGAVHKPAAADTAVAVARRAGHPRLLRFSAQDPATTIIPAVAATESAKPRSRASAGSKPHSSNTVPASAGMACRARPVPNASRVIAPMTAARRTLGCGPTRTTKPARASAAIMARISPRRRLRRSGHSTAPMTMAQFVPDTAVRCDRPLTRKSSARTASIPAVSPWTIPRRSPASSGPSVRSARSRRPPRMPAATESSTPCGGADASGGPRAKAMPTRRSSGEALASSSFAETVDPGRRCPHPWAGAKTRSSPFRDQDRTVQLAHDRMQVTALALPRTSTRGSLAPEARMRIGSVTWR